MGVTCDMCFYFSNTADGMYACGRVCVLNIATHLLHTESYNSHSAKEVRTFLQSGVILAAHYNFKSEG